MSNVVCDMPAAEYHGLSAWSISQLKLLPKKPELFHGYFVTHEYEFDETAGMLFGTNCHAEFLEGKTCSEVPDYALTSNGQRRGKAWEAYQATHSALECLSAKECVAVRGIRKSLESQPMLADLLWGEGETELSIISTDDETGLPTKGRLDKLRRTPRGKILVDLKITAIDPDDERAVQSHVFKMQYPQQLDFYGQLIFAATGEPVAGTVLILCRNTAPFTARAWPASQLDLEWGRRRNREALRDLAARLPSGDWTGYRHNRILPGPDGNLLPSYAFTDEPVDGSPYTYPEFNQSGEDQ